MHRAVDLDHPKKTCENRACGCVFKPTRVFQKYCKTRCQANAAYQRRNGGRQTKRCKTCGVPFTRGPERWAYCNGMCRDIAIKAYWKSDRGRQVKREWQRKATAEKRRLESLGEPSVAQRIDSVAEVVTIGPRAGVAIAGEKHESERSCDESPAPGGIRSCGGYMLFGG